MVNFLNKVVFCRVRDGFSRRVRDGFSRKEGQRRCRERKGGVPKEEHVFCQGRKAGNRWVRKVCLAKCGMVFLAEIGKGGP